MIKSMTGFGRAEEIISGRDIIVEIRSVNHRYFEFSARVPRAYGYLEEKLKSYISGKISRGKVEVSVTVTAVETSDALIEVNKSVAKGYVDALRSANEEENIFYINLVCIISIFQSLSACPISSPSEKLPRMKRSSGMM